MRKSICNCEPAYSFAGDVKTRKFIYTTGEVLSKGSSIKFDIHSKGRSCDWQRPQNVLLELPNKKLIKGFYNEEDYFEFTLPIEINIGESFAIILPDSRAQTFAQRKRTFSIFIDPKGKKEFRDGEHFFLDVKGSVLKNIKILAPSFVIKNKRFDVTVRFEDNFGNLTNNVEEGTLINISYDTLRENLSWNLFIPDGGFITLPNLYFNEEGIYKIKLKNLKTNDIFYSYPIKCFNDSEVGLFWGIFHGELEKTNSTDNIEDFLRICRDEKALNFVAVSPFESESSPAIEETSSETWKKISHHVAEMNEDERFNVFLGFQWCGLPKEEGLRHFIYSKDAKPILRKKDSKYSSLKKIYKSFPNKEFTSVPSFTMGKNSCFDFKDFNPLFERVVEIYNAWGSSEGFSDREIKGNGVSSDKEGSIIKALMNNIRFGFIAGGYDDRGIYQDLYDTNQVQYSEGLTAVIATEQTRDGILSALHNRSCFATTGERILLNFNIANKPMGSELTTETKPGLEFVRFISGFVVGTKKIKEVRIMRNDKIFKTFTPDTEIFEFSFEDTDKLQDVVIKEQFVFYYLKAIQEDGHIAWGSPIWIDISKNKKKTKIL